MRRLKQYERRRDPDPGEIARECERIQDGWTVKEERERGGGRERVRWELPEYWGRVWADAGDQGGFVSGQS